MPSYFKYVLKDKIAFEKIIIWKHRSQTINTILNRKNIVSGIIYLISSYIKSGSDKICMTLV